MKTKRRAARKPATKKPAAKKPAARKAATPKLGQWVKGQLRIVRRAGKKVVQFRRTK